MTSQQSLITAQHPTGADQPPRWKHPRPDVAMAASLLLIIGSLVASARLGGVFPSPFANSAEIAKYFATEPDAVHAGSVLVFGSAIALAVGVAAIVGRLQALGGTGPGSTFGLTGGLISAGMLAQSALVIWVLSRPEVRQQEPLVRALQYFAFLTGGVGHVVFLGLLVAGIAGSGLLLRLLPRSLAVVGLVFAAIAMLSTTSLTWNQAAVLLPIGRFPSLIWLIVAGYLLVTGRRSR